MNLINITMTHSGIYHDKTTGQAFVLVRFERPSEEKPKKKVVIGGDGIKTQTSNPVKPKDHEMEIKIPSCEVILNNGFDKDEEEEIVSYLRENGRVIMDKARAISSFKHIFGD